MATRILTSSAFAALTIWLGYFAQRDHFWPMFTIYAVFFGLYWAVVFRKKTHTRTDEKWFIGTGIALRALLLFSLPNFSDDFYRFLWDGHLAAAGVHPFAHPPVYFVENQCLPASVPAGLFEKLNSPHYFTVYPPVCQAVFWLAAKLAPGSVWGGIFVLKIFLFACEIATILTVDGGRLTVDGPPPSAVVRPSSIVLIYALNPLAILEIVGNCHFEGAMIFGLVAGLHFLRRKNAGAAALCWAFAVAAKLLPVLFLPLIVRELGWKRALRSGLVFAAASLLLWLPLLDGQVLQNMAASLDLYFQKFEFNASIYYLLREIGCWLKGYNTGYFIGPMLGFCTVGVVLWLAFGHRKIEGASRLGTSLDSAMLWASAIYLFLASTVHSWYITVPLVLAVRARWRFPVVWSGTAMLSYSHYAGGGFRENYGLIALEYALVWGCLAWEIWTFARANRPAN
ncbi:MAG: glycosyltransferase 87 family protein [Saprospiraceae bacterium]